MLQAFADGALFGEVTGSPPVRLLALHGWARTHKDFAEVTRGFDALALDLPGFGSSPAPPEAWGGADYAAAVAEAVAPSLTEPVVVLGHSFGGRVAVHLAAAQPDLVRALVLTGVPLLRPEAQSAPRPALAFRVGRALHRAGLVNDDRMEALRQKYGSRDYANAEGVMRQVHVRAVHETYEAPMSAIVCPVGLVWGELDTAAPVEVARRAAEMLGERAELSVVPGVDHMTPLRPAGVAALRAAIEGELS
jgi:pimeloyl-ACP methyl ester carboxylesterase